MSFNRSKVIAVLTGVISLLLGIAYLVLVQVLDSRGEMIPAPTNLTLVSYSTLAQGASHAQSPLERSCKENINLL